MGIFQLPVLLIQTKHYTNNDTGILLNKLLDWNVFYKICINYLIIYLQIFIFYLVLFICQLDLEVQLSSHESASDSSSVEDHVQDSRSMISTQVPTMPVKSTQHETNEQLPVTEADDNTFMAHVIIEQALHLPTVPGDNDTRYSVRSIQ